MPSPEEIAAVTSGALIFIEQGGQTIRRPAAFIFDLPDGVAWVEPSYADPYGASSPALHIRRGRPVDGQPDSLQGDGWILSVGPAYPPELEDGVGLPLAWFADYLASTGRTYDEERERVRELIAGAL